VTIIANPWPDNLYTGLAFRWPRLDIAKVSPLLSRLPRPPHSQLLPPSSHPSPPTVTPLHASQPRQISSVLGHPISKTSQVFLGQVLYRPQHHISNNKITEPCLTVILAVKTGVGARLVSGNLTVPLSVSYVPLLLHLLVLVNSPLSAMPVPTTRSLPTIHRRPSGKISIRYLPVGRTRRPPRLRAQDLSCRCLWSSPSLCLPSSLDVFTGGGLAKPGRKRIQRKSNQRGEVPTTMRSKERSGLNTGFGQKHLPGGRTTSSTLLAGAGMRG
jgi:hypothetical protein